MTWKLWLDDQLDDPICPVRTTPDGFLGAKSSGEAIILVNKLGLPEFMDLDHDLGEGDDALVFLNWLSFNFDKPPEYKIHSQNPIGQKRIISFMESWKGSLND